MHIDHNEIRRQCLVVDCAADAARVPSLYVLVLWRHVHYYNIIIIIIIFTLGIKDPEGFEKKIRRKLSE